MMHKAARNDTQNPAGTVRHIDNLAQMIQSTLYFGSLHPSGSEFSSFEFLDFADAVISPRFPGYTITRARGSWKGKAKLAHVVTLIYTKEDRAPMDTAIEDIRAEYKQKFEQESVMRVDTLVNVSF